MTSPMLLETAPFPGSDATYTAFVHLNAEKAPLYRAILGAFVAERARFALALRPSEIQTALAGTSGPAPPPDEVDSALRQLCDWGNLDDSPDTAEAAAVEDRCTLMLAAGLRKQWRTIQRRALTCDTACDVPFVRFWHSFPVTPTMTVLSGSTAVTRLLDGESRDASRKDFSRSLD